MSESRTDRRISVAFRTLGCKVNRVESEDIAADVLGRGVSLAEENEAAVVVLNTCTVTGEADAKARKAVRQALGAASRPVVVVTGCLAALDPEALAALGERVVVEADKERVADRVAGMLGIETEDPATALPRVGQGFRTRAMLKIEDGCDAFCSYCIVPYARGVPRSVPLSQLALQAASLVEAGVREIVLTGINLGRYRDGGHDLVDVVETIAGSGVERLRLSSIEPADLDDRLLTLLGQTPSACRHLHVPLQSGSDEVLAAMRRGYSVADYEGWIASARAALPGLVVTTDVIAGFPEESEAQAAETLAAVERIGFAKLHVFRYSQRPGTPAASMRQVPPEVRASRATALRESGERLRRRFAESRLGSVAEVLVERIAEDGTAEGTTTDYLKVRFHAPTGVAVGDLRQVRLSGTAGDTVLGSSA